VQCLAGVEGLAILTSADFLLDIQRLALDNDIEPSSNCIGGWKMWTQAVRSLGQGHMPPGSSGMLNVPALYLRSDMPPPCLRSDR